MHGGRGCIIKNATAQLYEIINGVALHEYAVLRRYVAFGVTNGRKEKQGGLDGAPDNADVAEEDIDTTQQQVEPKCEHREQDDAGYNQEQAGAIHEPAPVHDNEEDNDGKHEVEQLAQCFGQGEEVRRYVQRL